MKKFKLGLMAGVMAVSFSAMAAFTGGMSATQVDSEVQQRLAAGSTVNVIATSAKSSGISGGLLTGSLISQGQDSCKVVTSLVGAGFSANAVVNAAKASGGKYDTMVGCAIAAGADPTTLTDATAAGNNGNNGNPGNNGSNGNPGFSGGNGPTFSGGGGSGGSRS